MRPEGRGIWAKRRGDTATRTIADAGISLGGLSATVIGKSFVCLLAFDFETDAKRAAEALASTLAKKAKKQPPSPCIPRVRGDNRLGNEPESEVEDALEAGALEVPSASLDPPLPPRRG